MIARVHARGHNLAGLLWYLYSPGRRAEHDNPRLAAGWRHPARLEPPRRPGGQRDFRRLTGLMEVPLALLGSRAPAEHVWHCSIRAAPGDPVLGDGAWMRIAARVMDRVGLSQAGRAGAGCPWVAVHHGDQHIHIVAVLGRLDGRRAQLHNDYYRIGETLAEIEAEYGLQPTARPDRTATPGPTRAETEKARAAGRPEPARVTLQRAAAAAAAAARSEPEFFAGLAQRGVRARVRAAPDGSGPAAGYSVSLSGDLGAGGRPVWFGGGQLAPDLSLPKLRHRWPGPAGPPPRPGSGPTGRERLSGGLMSDGAAKAALRSEVTRAAAAARAGPQFWAALSAAGLLVRQRPGQRPGEASGYSVSLPGLLHHRDRQQVWYSGGTLAPELSLAALRRRWRAGLPGAAPGPELFGDAGSREIYAYAATVAADAARRIRAARGDAADVAWAASDLIAAAAEATGSRELRLAAAGFARAGRAPWGRLPVPSPAGTMLRTAATLLARCRPGGWPARPARIALLRSLRGLARAIADLRAQQHRMLQAAAAREAAAGLAALDLPEWTAPPLPGLTAPGTRGSGPGRRRPGPAPGPRARPRR